MTEYIGVDEAGRGPVLGPLVVALVHWNPSRLPDPPLLRDSKRMNAEQRETAASFIRSHCRVAVVAVPAWALARQTDPMTVLEARAIAGSLRHMPSASVICDRLETGHRSHELIRRAHPDRELRFESGADDRHPGVSAASVVAKIERDRALAQLRERWGEMGSGYASDPSTRGWLEQWARSGRPWPHFVRTNWRTIQELTFLSRADSDR